MKSGSSEAGFSLPTAFFGSDTPFAPPVLTCATVVLPVSTWPRLLFIALHIICVRIRPEAPTTAPMATSRGLRIARPETEAATPDSEFSKDTVIGMSAPPTRMVKSTPYANDAMSAIMLGHIAPSPGTMMARTPAATDMIIARVFTNVWFANITGRWFILPASFPAAIRLPESVTAPTRSPRTAVTFSNGPIVTGPSSVRSETMAELPPPNPFSKATI